MRWAFLAAVLTLVPGGGQAAQQQFQHELWDRVLRSHVTEKGLVD